MQNLENTIDRIQELIDSDTEQQLKEELNTYHEADLADIFQQLTPEERLKCFTKLDEEKAGYEKLGRLEGVADINAQKAVIEKYLPKMMSEEEIRKIIASLEDKSMPSVMKHFKMNYDGKVDMSLVSKIARE